MMNRFTYSVLVCLLFVSNTLLAQSRTVNGTVKDATGSGVPGAGVKIKGTTKGTSTGAAGEFKLDGVAENATLEISAIGYETQSVSVPASGDLSIILKDAATSLDEVVISVGSRNSKRTLTDTPLPIDIVSTADLKSTGQTTFDKALQYRVPSFNTVQTPVNDATSLLDPYEIRNMGPSRTLILINGKRKNSSALTYIQTSPGRGESGADISAIPTEAIKRVEILRDGASAQYGSDAIAGVMNIILKDRFEYGSVTLNSGVTHKGDGGVAGITLNNGANFGEKGYINYTVGLSHVGLANRPGVVSAEAEADGDLGFGAPLSDVQAFLKLKPDAGNINGSPETAAAKFSVNGGVGIGANSELYYTGAYVFKKVNSFANYRTPYWRTSDDGLLHAAGTPYLGYVPTFEGDLNDYNGTIGVRSEKNGWKSDVSFTVGGNKQLYTVSNSRNRGLGKNSPIQFKPGGYEFSHKVGNIDLSKALSEKVNLSVGSEFRAEEFTIIAGDTASYATAPGADSFPGISAANAKTSTRYNFGAYVGLGIDITKDFLIDGTARLEKYSDFGNAFVWKISSRYKFADDKVTLRASISTGFRAPSMAQSNLQLAQASFVPGQGIQTKGIVNNNSPQAFLLGVPKLKAENSVNFTAGLGLNPTKNFSATLDFYSIKVDNRIILSSEIAAGSGAQAAALNKILEDNGIVAVSFFVNGINTLTQGLDFVANYKNVVLGKGKLAFNFAGNYTLKNAKVGEALTPSLIKAAGQSIIDATQEALLLTSRPKYKAILGVDYVVGKMNFNVNNTLFGPTTFRQNGLNANLKTVFDPKIVTDLGANFQLGKSLTLGLNINNLFNIMPKWNLVALNAAGEAILKDPKQVFFNTNLITFNGRYSNVTYDGSHFSQLGTTFAANLNLRF
ncbi:Vitamin B12 transporter BtuB [Emticicia aquatica]|uniref:Vitamin B12 transporter BtuB n=1 Tax=Emticicia aquatica TaxID=1681835 RepID=A0ABM9APU1_9BACT|nr:TonB-dependent receptor [Emticicia aquatica]CAH0995293.1 Vitamin B12 transporter BtuB [Emticicia aquatica]